MHNMTDLLTLMMMIMMLVMTALIVLNGRKDGRGDGVQYCDMMSSLARNNNISMHDMREFKSNILKVSLPFP